MAHSSIHSFYKHWCDCYVPDVLRTSCRWSPHGAPDPVADADWQAGRGVWVMSMTGGALEGPSRRSNYPGPGGQKGEEQGVYIDSWGVSKCQPANGEGRWEAVCVKAWERTKPGAFGGSSRGSAEVICREQAWGGSEEAQKESRTRSERASMSQPMLSEHILCAKHWAWYWGYSVNKSLHLRNLNSSRGDGTYMGSCQKRH